MKTFRSKVWMSAIGLAVGLVLPALVVAAPPTGPGAKAPQQIMPVVKSWTLTGGPNNLTLSGQGPATKDVDLVKGGTYLLRVWYTVPPQPRGFPGPFEGATGAIATVGAAGGQLSGQSGYEFYKGDCFNIPVLAPGKTTQSFNLEFTIPAGLSLKVNSNVAPMHIAVLNPLKECKKS